MRRSKILQFLVRGMLVMAMVVAATVTPTPAQAHTDLRALFNRNSRTCLDANPYTWFNNRSEVYMWPCHGGNNQKWFANYPRHGWGEPYYTFSEIRTIGPPSGPANKCLDAWPAPGVHTGYLVSTWDCNGQSQQQWVITNYSTPIGWLTIRNVRFNQLCLDVLVPWNRPPEKRPVGLWSCHNSGSNAHQEFS